MYKGNVAYLWHQYETTTGGFSWIWNLRSRDSPDGRTVRQTGETSHRQFTSCTIAGGLLTFNNICSSDASCPGDGYRGARQRRILSIDLSMEDV